MINSLITLLIGLANIIGILLVYYSFGKNADRSKKFINTMITIGIMYIIVLITYTLRSLGIENTSASSAVKTMMIMAFVPVNTILFAPFLIHSYRKSQDKELSIESLNKRVIVIGILAVIIVVSEFFYFRSLQKGIVKMAQEKNQITANELANEQENSLKSNNEIVNNTIENKIINNTLGNTVNSNSTKTNITVNNTTK